MNIRAVVLATTLLLAACREASTSSPPPTPLPPPVGQAVDALTYLAQHRCPNGSPPNSCSAPVAQLTTDLEFYRKLDWPGPWSGIISDSVWGRSSGDDIIISTFSTAPFGAFNPPNDGGDVYGVDANTGNAVALKTRDGSLKADLYFVGENCGGGGTGWVLFGPTVPTGSWASQVAEIGQAASPAGCGRLSAAYTQYRLEQVPIPFIIDGQQQILSLPTIISEHYNGKDPTTAIMLERFYFASNWGKVRWERWDKRGSPRAGLAQECPTVPTWGSAPPFAGAIMTDCRNWTNIITAAARQAALWRLHPPGTFSISEYGWGWP
jgi:hypothetical protein